MMVDPHRVFVEAVGGLLHASGERYHVVGAQSVQHGLQLTADAPVDMVLLEWSLADADAEAAARSLRRNVPRAHMVLLAAMVDGRRLRRCIDAGFSGVLTKDMSGDALLSALATIRDGARAISPRLLPLMGVSRRSEELSDREVEVLSFASLGMSNAEIAGAVYLSENTVRNHLQRASAKLGTASRVSSVIAAIRLGYLEIPSAPRKLMESSG